MKKILLIVLYLGLNLNIFAQKVIKNPICENFSSGITVKKVILEDTITNIIINYKSRPHTKYSIGKSSFIQVDDSSEKLIITSANGLKPGKNYRLDETGQATFIYSFPSISKDAKIIHFRENEKESKNKNFWHIDNIYIQPGLYLKYLPDEFAGDWRTSDNKHKWTISFTKDLIVYNGNPYKITKNNYQIKQKGKKYRLAIGGNNLYLQMDNNNLMIGKRKKSMTKCVKIDFLKKLKGVSSFSVPEMEIKQDTAYYRGFIKNYDSKSGKTVRIMVDNILTGSQDSYIINIDSTGWFETKIPMYYPHEVNLSIPTFGYCVFLVPGDTLTQMIKNREIISLGKYGEFSDEYEKIYSIANSFKFPEVMKITGEMSPDEYKTYCDKCYDKDLGKWEAICKEKGLNNEIAKTFRRIIKRIYIFNSCAYSMIKRTYAYQQKNEGKEYKYQKINPSYYINILKDVPIESEEILYHEGIGSIINFIKYEDWFIADKSIYNKISAFKELLKNGFKISKEEWDILEKYDTLKDSEILKQFSANTDSILACFFPIIKKYDKNWRKHYAQKDNEYNNIGYYTGLKNYILDQKNKQFSEKGFKLLDKIITYETSEYIKTNNEFILSDKADDKVVNKYNSEIEQKLNTKNAKYSKGKIIEYFGKRGELLSEIIVSQILCPDIKTPEPLSPEQIKFVDKNISNKFIHNYIIQSNEKVLQYIADNKKETVYTKTNSSETKGDKLFAKLIKPFKGKVIYVDFWGTYCGSCISGIKKIAPLKEELIKRDDIIFMYITDTSSPEKLYNSMISNIKGKHYRISTDQSNYLIDKFKIVYVPHYILVNKIGEVVINNLNIDPNQSNLKSILLKYAKE